MLHVVAMLLTTRPYQEFAIPLLGICTGVLIGTYLIRHPKGGDR
jgi:hypothetical protein